MSRPRQDPLRQSDGQMLLYPGSVVHEMRTRACITQAGLAERLGVSRLTIVNLERLRGNLSMGLALRLEKFFGIQAEELVALQLAIDARDTRFRIAAELERIEPMPPLKPWQE